MQFRARFLLAFALLLAATTGAKCISVADDSVISVNIENITGTYSITAGATQFASPTNCVTKQVSDYLDADYGVVQGGRLVDIQYQANGTFAGTISNGTVTVNGAQILSYSGPWSTLTTKQSLLTGSTLTSHPAGVQALITAVQNSQAVVLCVGGGFSQAAPAGLSVTVQVFAQVDVIPD